MWNRYHSTQDFKDHQPWLLRYFDQIRFYPVSEAELLQLRKDFITGRFTLRIEASALKLTDYSGFLQQNSESIQRFKAKQTAAFDAERKRWQSSEESESINENIIEAADPGIEVDLPTNAEIVLSPVTGTIWKQLVVENQQIKQQEPLLIIESMKMEFPILSPSAGVVRKMPCKTGSYVSTGQIVCVIEDE